MYGLVFNLKAGSVPGRTYGIASDIEKEFVEQIHSYISVDEKDTKTGVFKRKLWRKVKPHDHGFICAAQELVLAIECGFYPLANVTEERKAA